MKRMGKRDALYWAQALWRCWQRSKSEDAQRFYSRMVVGPAESLGCRVFRSYLEHAE